MLTILSDTFLSSLRMKHWDAPERYKVRRGPRSNLEIEREAAERRHHAMRDVGMW